MFIHLRLLDILDILIVAFLFYRLYLLIRGTRAVQVAKGLSLLLVFSLLAQKLQLHTVDWILKNFWTIGVIGFLIVFQPELRRLLAQIGQNRLFSLSPKVEEQLYDEITEAVVRMSEKRMGGIIVLERDVGLKTYIETGVRIDSRATAELLSTIFTPGSPLHDGAVIIKEGRIAAASCILPLSQNPDINKKYGTRHSAAVGITEETDALAIVVSEETGGISLAVAEEITLHINRDTLREMLTLYGPRTERRFSFWPRR